MEDSSKNSLLGPDDCSSKNDTSEKGYKVAKRNQAQPLDRAQTDSSGFGEFETSHNAESAGEGVSGKETIDYSAKFTVSSELAEPLKLFQDEEYPRVIMDGSKTAKHYAEQMRWGDDFVARIEAARVDRHSEDVDMARLELLRSDEDIRRKFTIALMIVMAVLLAGIAAGATAAIFL